VIQKTKMNLEAKDVLPNLNRTQAAERAKKMPFLFLVTLILDLQTCSSEGPNMTSSLLCMLPVSVARCSPDDNAICYVFVVLWMTLSLTIIGQAKVLPSVL